MLLLNWNFRFEQRPTFSFVHHGLHHHREKLFVHVKHQLKETKTTWRINQIHIKGMRTLED